MNTEEYLKSIGQDPAAQPSDDTILSDPRVKAALDAQKAEFQDELKDMREFIDAKRAEEQKANDPNRYATINGQRIELPEDESTWDEWMGAARGKLDEIRSNPEATTEVISAHEQAFDQLRGEHFKFLARQQVPGREEPVIEQKPEVRGLSQEQESAMHELGLAPGTKGHRAVTTMVNAGTPFVDALDMIGVEVEEDDLRSAPQNRDDANLNAGKVPAAGQNGMQPPPSVRVRARGGNTTDQMNAALAARMKAKRDPRKIFNK